LFFATPKTNSRRRARTERNASKLRMLANNRSEPTVGHWIDAIERNFALEVVDPLARRIDDARKLCERARCAAVIAMCASAAAAAPRG
jgi:hypothetical protein